MHDPGFAFAFAQLKPDQSIDEAQQILLKTVEGLANEPPSQEEVDRAKTRILKNIELALTNSQSIGMMLGGYVGDGDWRSFFLTRDEMKKVTPADVARVAKAYLKSSNRTLGEFIPTTAPDRAEIPATPDPAVAVQGLQRRRDDSAGRSVRSDASEHRSSRDPRQTAERVEAGDVPQEDARRHRGGLADGPVRR